MKNGKERERAKGQRSDCQPELQGILRAKGNICICFTQCTYRSGLGKRTPEPSRIKSHKQKVNYLGVCLLLVTSVLLLCFKISITFNLMVSLGQQEHIIHTFSKAVQCAVEDTRVWRALTITWGGILFSLQLPSIDLGSQWGRDNGKRQCSPSTNQAILSLVFWSARAKKS